VPGYTKLFSSIVGSTIWREDPATKVVWVTMLALADQDGIVEASVPGLADYARVTVEQTETALGKFLAPDPYSRSPENEGRRIEPVEGGWRLLNHPKYRYKMSKENIRERDRIRKQRYRDQKMSHENWDKTGQRGNVRDFQHSEAEAEAKAKPEAKVHPPIPPSAVAAVGRGRRKKHSAAAAKKHRPPTPLEKSVPNAAIALCRRLSIVGKRSEKLIRQAVQLEADKTGQTASQVCDRMFDAWQHYKNGGGLSTSFEWESPVAFLTNGAWLEADKGREACEEAWKYVKGRN
jgi:hypothetical protein